MALPRGPARSKGLQIVPDIAPHISPVDHSVVGSRSARREHNIRNDVIDVGNDSTLAPGHKIERPAAPGLEEDVRRAFDPDWGG